MKRRMSCVHCGRTDDVYDKDKRSHSGRLGGWYCCEDCEHAEDTGR